VGSSSGSSPHRGLVGRRVPGHVVTILAVLTESWFASVRVSRSSGRSAEARERPAHREDWPTPARSPRGRLTRPREPRLAGPRCCVPPKSARRGASPVPVSWNPRRQVLMRGVERRASAATPRHSHRAAAPRSVLPRWGRSAGGTRRPTPWEDDPPLLLVMGVGPKRPRRRTTARRNVSQHEYLPATIRVPGRLVSIKIAALRTDPRAARVAPAPLAYSSPDCPPASVQRSVCSAPPPPPVHQARPQFDADLTCGPATLGRRAEALGRGGHVGSAGGGDAHPLA